MSEPGPVMFGDCCCEDDEWDFRFTWRLPNGGGSDAVEVIDLLNAVHLPGLLPAQAGVEGPNEGDQPYAAGYLWLASGVILTKPITPLSSIRFSCRQTIAGGFGGLGQGLLGMFDILHSSSFLFFGDSDHSQLFNEIEFSPGVVTSEIVPVIAMTVGHAFNSSGTRRATFPPGIELIVHGHVRTERL